MTKTTNEMATVIGIKTALDKAHETTVVLKDGRLYFRNYQNWISSTRVMYSGDHEGIKVPAACVDIINNVFKDVTRPITLTEFTWGLMTVFEKNEAHVAQVLKTITPFYINETLSVWYFNYRTFFFDKKNDEVKVIAINIDDLTRSRVSALNPVEPFYTDGLDTKYGVLVALGYVALIKGYTQEEVDSMVSLWYNQYPYLTKKNIHQVRSYVFNDKTILIEPYEAAASS